MQHSDYRLTAKDKITFAIRQKGITSWNALCRYVQLLPYGRNYNRHNLLLVIEEQKGTCSSKHALLKHVADVNNIPNVHLLMGIYKMNEINTPKIGNTLVNNKLNYIPEAHCYLKIDDKKMDLTSPNASFTIIAPDILVEITITPAQVNEYKISYHKTFIKQWLANENIPLSFKQAWKIRETCISLMSL